MVEIAGLSGAALNQIDVTIDDGTVTICGPGVPAPKSLTNARGMNWLFPLFATLSDSMASTGIYDVNVLVQTNANPTAGTCRVYFFGSN